MAPKANSFGEALCVGGTVGAVEACMMFPFEFVKTQLQLQDQKNPIYNGSIDCIRKTVRADGVRGLYRGLSVLVAGSAPKQAVRFGAYEAAAKALRQQSVVTNESALVFGAGLIAGSCEGAIVVTAAETMKTRLIHDMNAPSAQRQYRGLVHGVSTVARQEGISGLYRGMSATVLKQGSNQAVRFLVKTKAERQIANLDTESVIPRPLRTALAGAVAGAASVAANNPLDVIKSKMQGIGAKEAGHGTFMSATRSVLRSGGVAGFYAGVAPRLVRVMGDASISFTLYDEVSRLYRRVRDGDFQ